MGLSLGTVGYRIVALLCFRPKFSSPVYSTLALHPTTLNCPNGYRLGMALVQNTSLKQFLNNQGLPGNGSRGIGKTTFPHYSGKTIRGEVFDNRNEVRSSFTDTLELLKDSDDLVAN